MSTLITIKITIYSSMYSEIFRNIQKELQDKNELHWEYKSLNIYTPEIYTKNDMIVLTGCVKIFTDKQFSDLVDYIESNSKIRSVDPVIIRAYCKDTINKSVTTFESCSGGISCTTYNFIF